MNVLMIAEMTPVQWGFLVFALLFIIVFLAVFAQAGHRVSPAATGGGPGGGGMPAQRLFELFPNLGEMPGRPGGRMSGGEQQMLTVARTLMGNPRLVLLDEPSEGVAPLIVEQMADMIDALKRQGLSVLLSEQNLPFASAVSDRAYVLEKGQVRFAGTMAALEQDETVRRQYLTV